MDERTTDGPRPLGGVASVLAPEVVHGMGGAQGGSQPLPVVPHAFAYGRATEL